MSAIAKVFENLKRAGDGAYIPYVCCGDRGTRFTTGLVKRLTCAGADIVELGLPFSDPLADGPTIQSAMVRALSSGFRTQMLFDTISTVRSEDVKVPIVVMTYYNPIVRMGEKAFCENLSKVGADAVLAVDLPIEESSELDAAAADNGLDVIKLVAPTTGDERARRIMNSASGFVYAVSVSGVTGAKDSLPDTALALLKRLSDISAIPVALGFGISNRRQVMNAMSAGASGVVEGSALISIYSQSSLEEDALLDLVEKHARELKNATKQTLHCDE
ncbi:MAG: tryptophan synthase subunit alpha [Methanobacteriota archaeon]|nr:MAG: tryptophan synthase subunit alpha [Euryarchaeota archaeon]